MINFLKFIIVLFLCIFFFVGEGIASKSEDDLMLRARSIEKDVLGLMEVVRLQGRENIKNYDEIIKALHGVYFEVIEIICSTEKNGLAMHEKTLYESIFKNSSSKCYFKDDFWSSEIEIYFNSGKVFLEDDGYYLLIDKDEMVYMWDEHNYSENEGVKFLLKESPTPPRSMEGLFEEIKMGLTECKKISIDEEIFKLPKETKFLSIKEYDSLFLDSFE